MYLLIFVTLGIFAVLKKDKTPNNMVFIFLIITVVLFVGFRGEDIDNDYSTYLLNIEEDNGISEITFKWISSFFYKYLNSTTLTFVFYAALGVSLKFISFKKHSNFFYLTLLMYYSTFFILQEMNAMRAGVASGFMLLSFDKWGGGDKKQALPYILIAALFHYSFSIIIPILFLVSNSKKSLVYYLLLIPISYILYSSVDINNFIPINIDYVYEKINAYKSDFDTTDIFSTVFLIKILFISILYIYRKKLEVINSKFYLFFKLYCIGIFMLVLFAKLPSASTRFMDIFVVVELFLLPTLCKLTRHSWIPTLVLILYSFFYFYLYVEVGEYIREYYTIFSK